MEGTVRATCGAKATRRFRGAALPMMALLLAVLLRSTEAHAQANYEGLQVGGRTAMMGGASVAGGSDQATVFVNPATISRIRERSFSFSTFALQARARSIQDSLDASDTLQLRSPDVNQFKLRIQPNTFCYFLDGPPKDEYSGRSRHKFGLCAAATEREEMEFTKNRSDSRRDGAATFGSAHSTNLKWVRSTLAMGWALQLNRDTAIGVTSRIDNARLNDQTTATSYASVENLGVIRTLDHSIEAWSWDTSLVVGLTYALSRRVTLGVSLATPSQHLFGRYVSLSTSTASDAPSTLTQDNGDFRYNHPGSLRMGFSFAWPRLIIGVDGSFYGPQRDIARANFDRVTTAFENGGRLLENDGAGDEVRRASVSERGKPVTNLAFGAEFFLRPDFSLVAGAQTDFSGLHPRQTQAAEDVLFRQQKDAIHAAVGVTTYGEAGRLLVGVRGHIAHGNVLVADASLADPEFVAVPQSEWGLNLLISGSLTFRAVRQVAKKAIPRPDPKNSRTESEEEEEP